MLACARIGAIHSVVFGGFAAASLATRIDDAQAEGDGHRRRRHARRQGGALQAPGRRGDPPVAAPAGQGADRQSRPRPGDDARRRARPRLRGAARAAHGRAGALRVARVDASPRTSSTRRGTTGKPKGVQRDTGGYAVALAASMQHIFCVAARRDDVHHQRHRLGGRPLLHRLRAAASTASTTIMYEGLPIRPDPGIWWKIVAEHKVNDDVQLADGDPRAEEAGSGVHEEVRPVVAAVPVPRRRAARRADRALDRRRARRRRSSTTTGRPRPAGRSCRRSRASRRRRASSAARRSRSTATTCSCCTRPPARGVGPTRRAC